MAAEKKPRATKATAKTGSTKKTETTAKVPAAKSKTPRARKPKAVTAVAVTSDMIAERAYYIWADGSGGDAFANWVRAERELTAA